MLKKRDPSSQNYLNLTLDFKDHLRIGSRFELHSNPIPDLKRYEGGGISNKFIQFQKMNLDITQVIFTINLVVAFYFCSYFDSNLGIDNSMYGARIKYRPSSGIDLIGIIEKTKKLLGIR